MSTDPLPRSEIPEAQDEPFKDTEGDFTISLTISNAHTLRSSTPTLLGIYPTAVLRHDQVANIVCLLRQKLGNHPTSYQKKTP